MMKLVVRTVAARAVAVMAARARHAQMIRRVAIPGSPQVAGAECTPIPHEESTRESRAGSGRARQNPGKALRNVRFFAGLRVARRARGVSARAQICKRYTRRGGLYNRRRRPGR